MYILSFHAWFVLYEQIFYSAVLAYSLLYFPIFERISYNLISTFQVIQMNIQESALKQVAQELKINQSSQCPYIVVCYKSFYVNGAFSIILEYMDGGSLLDFLKKVKSIPEPYLAAISKQVGDSGFIFRPVILIISFISS